MQERLLQSHAEKCMSELSSAVGSRRNRVSPRSQDSHMPEPSELRERDDRFISFVSPRAGRSPTQSILTRSLLPPVLPAEPAVTASVPGPEVQRPRTRPRGAVAGGSLTPSREYLGVADQVARSGSSSSVELPARAFYDRKCWHSRERARARPGPLTFRGIVV